MDGFDGAIGPGLLAGKRSKGFVAEPAALFAPTPGDKGTFSKLGRNAMFESSPSVVHFGGFVLNKVHEQTIQVQCARGAMWDGAWERYVL